jgi:hypothetical protein
MKKEIQITVPKDWSAVTLEKYLALQKDLKVYGESNEGMIACLFHHLCGFDPKYLNSLDTEVFMNMKRDIESFIANTDLPLQKFINIDGIEYGFEPNLSKMSYGAYLDVTKHENLSIDDNWAEVMSILYRPVKLKQRQLYEIEPYTGDIDKEKFLKVTMDIHFGVLFFFINLLKDLLNSTLKSLMEQEGISPDIKSILEKSGNLIHQS